MQDKEFFENFLKHVDDLIEKKQGACDDPASLKEEWSENTHLFMKKYGHI